MLMKKTLVPLILLFWAFPSKAQHVVNGNMEHWHNVGAPVNSYCPDSSWYGLDSMVISIGKGFIHPGSQGYTNQVYSTNSAHTLTFGARILTVFQDTGTTNIGVTAGCLTNAAIVMDDNAVIVNHEHILDNLSFTGGMSITAAQRPSTVGAWIRYVPTGNDTAHIMVKVLNAGGTVIGSADSAITATINTYSYVAPHITYTSADAAAKLQLIFMSSPLGPNRGQVGSSMWIDDIDYTSTTSVQQTSALERAIRFYPNPGTGVVYLYSNVADNLSWQVFNANGQVIVNEALAANNRKDLSNLPAGTYFYNILNSKGEIVQKDKFTLVK